MLGAQTGVQGEDSIDSHIELSLFRGYSTTSADLPGPFQTGHPNESCGRFQEGSGSDWRLDLLLSERVASKFEIGIGAGLLLGTSTLSFHCVENAEIRLQDGSITTATTKFVREESTLSLMFSLLGRWLPADRLLFSAGVACWVPLSQNVELREEVVVPVGATFEDGSDVRKIVATAAETDPVLLFGQVRAGYRLTAGARLNLVPQLGVDVQLNSGVTRTVALTVGLGLGYRFNLFAPEESTPLEPASN